MRLGWWGQTAELLGADGMAADRAEVQKRPASPGMEDDANKRARLEGEDAMQVDHSHEQQQQQAMLHVEPAGVSDAALPPVMLQPVESEKSKKADGSSGGGGPPMAPGALKPFRKVGA